MWVFVGLIIIIGLLVWWQSRKFHVVNTDPGTNNVASISPFFKLNFNKPVSPSGFAASASPRFYSSYKIGGKTVTFSLNIPLSQAQTYTLTINHVSSTSGDQLSNLKFSFKPQAANDQNVSQSQSQALLQQQSQKPPSKNNVNFVGFDALLNYGVTNAQLNNLEQAFFDFKNTAQTVTIDNDSIKAVPHDPNSASMSDSINFTTKVDSIGYNARIDYSNITELRLYLYSINGNSLIFDSKTINSPSQ